ncbi:hypothetical protein N431DRAFT_426433 [Stipitochalara longipes BDJ]|nr:hypothetical protein N431DRAFT_426433 [Stipitochalara longipes BDJ]
MRSRLAKSTDPRDRIYSLLGLAEELFGGQPVDLAVDVLIVDYEASVEDVYSSLVKAVVMATKRLDILGACVPARIGYVQRT